MNEQRPSSNNCIPAPGEEIESIRIYFVPSTYKFNESLLVPSDPMAIPSSTSRKGLSLIVNHLLRQDSHSENESDERDIPFDFLLNGRLIRSSIGTYVRKYGLNIENPIEIQYFRTKHSPALNGVTPLFSEWITAMDHDDGYLLCTATYDGMIGAFMTKDGGLEERHIVKGHSGPIQCLDCNTISGNLIIATGSMDQTLVTHTYSRISESSDEGSLILHCRYSRGHAATISSTALIPLHDDENDMMMASGDWNGKLCIWKTSSNLIISDDSEGDKCHRQKLKYTITHSTAVVKDVSPIFNIDAHADNLSGISFGTNYQNVVITSSWDHCIKSWDVQTQNLLLTLNGSKVITCLTKCINSDVVASGHPDCTVRLWDMRIDNNGNKVGIISDSSLKRSHKAWINSVKWSKINPYVLSSSSHDGTIKVWDIRSSLPLHTIKAQERGHKVLCLAHESNMIYSGGTECVVRSFRF